MRGVLDVDVVGGQRRLELRVVEREQRRGATGDLTGAGRAATVLVTRCLLELGKPSKPSACEKRTTVLEEVFARRASSSAVWKAASSRWSTMYWATSFCDRENSSKRARI